MYIYLIWDVGALLTKVGMQLVLPSLLQHHFCKKNVFPQNDTVGSSTLCQILEPMIIKESDPKSQ